VSVAVVGVRASLNHTRAPRDQVFYSLLAFWTTFQAYGTGDPIAVVLVVLVPFSMYWYYGAVNQRARALLLLREHCTYAWVRARLHHRHTGVHLYLRPDRLHAARVLDAKADLHHIGPRDCVSLHEGQIYICACVPVCSLLAAFLVLEEMRYV
jgi:hypothetical protein